MTLATIHGSIVKVGDCMDSGVEPECILLGKIKALAVNNTRQRERSNKEETAFPAHAKTF